MSAQSTGGFIGAVVVCFGVGAAGGLALTGWGGGAIETGEVVDGFLAQNILIVESPDADAGLGDGGDLATMADPLAGGALPLTYAERINVRILDFEELSNEYRINEDETISVPGVGRIPVRGMSASQFEQLLTESLIELTGRTSTVTIEVVAYQPIFVSGAVEDPGAFTWARNLTVVQALSLAGGPYRGPEIVAGAGGEGSPRIALQQAQAGLKRAIARRARLNAEIAGRETVDTPADLVLLVGPTEAEALIAAEQSLLDSNLLSLSLQSEALDANLESLANEIVRLQELEGDLFEQLEIRRAYFEEVEQSARRGFVPTERVIELRGALAGLDERLSNVRVSMSRAESDQLAARRDQIALREARLAELSEELLELESEIESAQLTYDAALLTFRTFATPGVSTETGGPSALRFDVVRRTDQGLATLAADRFDPLLPGDVLVISAGQ